MKTQNKATTKGELEAEFTKAIVKFEKDYLGRGPLDARTYLLNDMVLVRLRGVLTPAEEKLSENKEGKTLVKDARRQLFETSRPILEGFVREILETELVDIYSDISTDSGERIIVLTTRRNFSK
ncbi:MAG TPA: DUF2294 domain-containing protein [Anaerolineales bacterium]|jgi:uncharacterized protein YbcI|nr:DUF2294 domain-containing protein [Anaerolineales bacterium]